MLLKSCLLSCIRSGIVNASPMFITIVWLSVLARTFRFGCVGFGIRSCSLATSILVTKLMISVWIGFSRFVSLWKRLHRLHRKVLFLNKLHLLFRLDVAGASPFRLTL